MMNENETVERLTKVEERSKSNTHRLDKLEPIVEEIHTLSKTMVQLVGEVRHTNESVSSLNDKVDKMDSLLGYGEEMMLQICMYIILPISL